MIFPVERPATFWQDFGQPRPNGRTHQGSDIFAPEGARLFAAEAGTVTGAANAYGGELALHLQGDSGARYYYAHNRTRSVAPGARVEAGAELGEVGRLGNAGGTRPHLHFEIHPANGAAIDPWPWLQGASTSQLENVTLWTKLAAAAIAAVALVTIGKAVSK